MGKKRKLLPALGPNQVNDHEARRQKLIKKKAAIHKSINNSHLKNVLSDSSGRSTEIESSDRDVESSSKFKKHIPNEYKSRQDRSAKTIDLLDETRVMGVELPKSSQLDKTRKGPFFAAEKGRFDDEAVSSVDIPLSEADEISEADRADLVPHERLTINNTTALLSAHASLSRVLSSRCLFSDTQAITSTSPTVESITDAEDDFTRELAFYKQCLDAVDQAQILLKNEGKLFSRPLDFFAEMVKSDDHMGKVKHKMTDEAASKKASIEAKRQRDLKRFGKQLQIAKEQERDKERRVALDKIESLKRKRRQANGPIMNTDEEDLFDVALEKVDKSNSRRSQKHAEGSGRALPTKRHMKDIKFGFGGKKRFTKSGDTTSSGDMRNFSVQKMKGLIGTRRLGKGRRASKGAL